MRLQIQKVPIVILVICMTTSCSNPQSKPFQKANTDHTSVRQKEIGLSQNPSNKVVKIDPYETLDGWLKLSVDQQTVLDSIGVPDIKDKDEYLGATGVYVQQWIYNALGIVLDMESDQENGHKKVMRITVSSPSTLKTSQNIRIGSDVYIVKAKYSSIIDKTVSNNHEIVIGSIYGGTVFSFENGKVSRIFIGTAAE